MGGLPAAVRRRAGAGAVVCAALLAVVYLLAVWTSPGQRFEDAVLRAADRAAGTAAGVRAIDTLDGISVTSVVAAAVVVLLVGLLRRQVLLGVLGVSVIAAAIACAEAIQHTLYRPILLSHGYRREDQSFPSGHAAVAMSVMCALVLVAPYRFRGPVVVVGSVWAASVEVATVTASWHRPSDTIGSDLIVVICACTAVYLLARWGRVRQAALRTPSGRALRALLTGGYAGIAVLAFAVAAVVVGIAVRDPEHTGAVNVLVAGRALALSGSAAVAVTLLALLRGIELGAPPAGGAEEGSPHDELRHDGVCRSSGT